MPLPLLLIVSLCLAACGGSHSAGSTTPVTGASDSTDTKPHPPADELAWWQGADPACRKGELKRRTLGWGSVYWCALQGQEVDANLQNDLGRLARCLNESVSAFQQEPELGKLGEFLARAHDEGLNPVLCSAVRRDIEPRTYHGRTIQFERLELAAKDLAPGEARVRYRLSCEDCLVASETTVLVAP